MKIKIALLAGASLLVLAGTSQAQEQEEATRLEAIVVSETGDENPTAPVDGYVAKSSASATKTGTSILETQQSVSVVTRDQIEDQGAQTLGQALSSTAGVTAEPVGVDPRFDAPSLRGFDMGDAQYLNGLRLMRNLGAPSFDIYGLERVEVLKGPSSVLYGSGNPAGILNMIQKRAQFDDAYEAGTGFSFDGDKEIFTDANKVFSDTFAARFTGKLSDTQEDIDELTNTRGYFGLAAKWTPTDATMLELLASYQKDSPITPTGVPFALMEDNEKRWRDFYFGDENFDNSDRRMLNFGYEFSHEFDSGWSVSQSARLQKFDWDYDGFYVNGSSTKSTVSRGIIYENEDTWTTNVDTRLSGQIDTGSVNHNLLFGLDLRRYDDNTAMQFNKVSDIDLADLSTLPATIGDPTWISADDLVLKQAGIYVQDELSFDNWRATLALRHDWADQHGSDGGLAINQQDQATTGHAGLSYLYDNGVAPYVSYSTSFDPVIGTDVDGNVLKPTEGKQWEVGLKYQPTGFDGLFSVAVFDLRQENVSVAVDALGGVRQIGEIRSRGVELEASMELGQGWGLKAAYTYLDADLTGDNDGNMPANVPHHNGSLWVNYDFAEASAFNGLSLSAGLRYIGERYGDDANTRSLHATTLVDLGAKYAINEHATVSLNVRNLTDETYISGCGFASCYYGSGRAIMGKLTTTW